MKTHSMDMRHFKNALEVNKYIVQLEAQVAQLTADLDAARKALLGLLCLVPVREWIFKPEINVAIVAAQSAEENK